MKHLYENTTKAVIIANGEYPTHAIPLLILAHASFVVCCDGAANKYLSRGYIPDAIVGDGDSLYPAYKEQYSDIIHPIQEQETNDLTKAVRFLQKKGIRTVTIVGATGKREDHTLGNISLLMKYYKEGIDVQMVTDYGIFIPAEGTRTFTSLPGQQVSIFSFDAKGLRSTDLRYPIYDFDNWWEGTLNESTSYQFTIECTGYYLLYKAYDIPPQTSNE